MQVFITAQLPQKVRRHAYRPISTSRRAESAAIEQEPDLRQQDRAHVNLPDVRSVVDDENPGGPSHAVEGTA